MTCGIETKSLPPWGTGDVAKGVAALVAVFIASLGAVFVLAGPLDLDRNITALAVTIAGQAAILTAVWWLTIRRYHLPWSALGWRPWRTEQARWAVPLGVLLSLTIAGVYAAIVTGLGVDLDRRTESFLDEPGTPVRVLLVVSAVFAAPLVEETFFRGFVFRGLRRRLTSRKAGAASAGLFALAHIDPLVFAPIFAIGLVLAWIYTQTGSLFVAMAVHAAYNGVIVAIALSAS